jgi:hypothetical protein
VWDEAQKFKSQGSVKRLPSSHGPIYNTFNLNPHLISRVSFRTLRGLADETWVAAAKPPEVGRGRAFSAGAA